MPRARSIKTIASASFNPLSRVTRSASKQLSLTSSISTSLSTTTLSASGIPNTSSSSSIPSSLSISSTASTTTSRSKTFPTSAEVNSEIGDDASPLVSKGTKRIGTGRKNDTLLEREMRFLIDPCTKAVGPRKVVCAGCGESLSLDLREKGLGYSPSNWVHHKKSCTRLAQLPNVTDEMLRTMPKLEVSRENLKANPERYILPLRVDKPYIEPCDERPLRPCQDPSPASSLQPPVNDSVTAVSAASSRTAQHPKKVLPKRHVRAPAAPQSDVSEPVTESSVISSISTIPRRRKPHP